MAETPRSANNDLNVTACFMPQASQNVEFSFFVSIHKFDWPFNRRILCKPMQHLLRCPSNKQVGHRSKRSWILISILSSLCRTPNLQREVHFRVKNRENDLEFPLINWLWARRMTILKRRHNSAPKNCSFKKSKERGKKNKKKKKSKASSTLKLSASHPINSPQSCQ